MIIYVHEDDIFCPLQGSTILSAILDWQEKQIMATKIKNMIALPILIIFSDYCKQYQSYSAQLYQGVILFVTGRHVSGLLLPVMRIRQRAQNNADCNRKSIFLIEIDKRV
jgi:hypothetical protein